MLKKIVLSSALILSSAAFASDYQTEVGVGHINFDGGSVTALNGEYHFNTVDTSNIALSEAAFYERSNNVFGTISGGDLDTQAIGAEFYLNNFYVAPSYTNIEIFGEDEGFFAVDLGYSPFNGLLISTSVPESDYDANLSVKYVTPLAGDRALNLEATLVDDASQISGDYYFNKTTGLGLALGEDIITISGEKFFTDKFKAGLSYSDADGTNLFAVDVALRF